MGNECTELGCEQLSSHSHGVGENGVREYVDARALPEGRLRELLFAAVAEHKTAHETHDNLEGELRAVTDRCRRADGVLRDTRLALIYAIERGRDGQA